MTQLPEVSKEFRTRDLWRAGLQEQLVQPRLCRSLVISVNRDYDFDVALDGRDLVVKVTKREDR